MEGKEGVNKNAFLSRKDFEAAGVSALPGEGDSEREAFWGGGLPFELDAGFQNWNLFVRVLYRMEKTHRIADL